MHKGSDMSSPPVLCYMGRWREGPTLSRTHLSTLWVTVPSPSLLCQTLKPTGQALQEELFWSWMLLTVARVMAACWHRSAWKDGRLLGHAQKAYTWRQATKPLVFYWLFSICNYWFSCNWIQMYGKSYAYFKTLTGSLKKWKEKGENHPLGGNWPL